MSSQCGDTANLCRNFSSFLHTQKIYISTVQANSTRLQWLHGDVLGFLKWLWGPQLRWNAYGLLRALFFKYSTGCEPVYESNQRYYSRDAVAAPTRSQPDVSWFSLRITDGSDAKSMWGHSKLVLNFQIFYKKVCMYRRYILSFHVSSPNWSIRWS